MKHIFLIGAFFLTPVFLTAMDTDSLAQSFQQRVDSLMEHSISKKSFQDSLMNIRKEHDEKMKGLSKEVDFIKTIGIPGTILAAIVFFYGVYRFSVSRFKSMFEEELGKYFEKRKDEIKEIVEAGSLELRVRKRMNILILSPDKPTEDNYKSVFKDLYIDNLSYGIYASQGIPQKIDMVIFNHLSDDDAKEILDNAPGRMLFVNYLTNRRAGFQNPKMIIANSPYTLYGHIINVFRYHHFAGPVS